MITVISLFYGAADFHFRRSARLLVQTQKYASNQDTYKSENLALKDKSNKMTDEKTVLFTALKQETAAKR